MNDQQLKREMECYIKQLALRVAVAVGAGTVMILIMLDW